MNSRVLATVAAGAVLGCVALSEPASANVQLLGGVMGTGPTGGKNDVFGPRYGGGPYPPATIPGWYFGDLSQNTGPVNFVYGALSLTEASNISFDFLGKEAGFVNAFQINTGSGWVTLRSDPSSPQKFVPVNPIPLGTYTFDAGIIQFRFVSLNNGYNATNGGTAIGSGYTKQASIFVTFLDAATNKPLADQAKGADNVVGNLFDVYYDDSGALNDDNHDDYGIRFMVSPVPVPLPAALPIIGAALAGFGFAGFRSRRNG